MTVKSSVKLGVEAQTDWVYVLPLPTTVPFFFHWYVGEGHPLTFAVHVLLRQPPPPGTTKYS